jgi:predicted nuclease with RNAse H fold
MTDETELLRQLIEREIDLLRQLMEREIDTAMHGKLPSTPADMRRFAKRIAEEVLRQLERAGAQVVRIHANRRDDQ